MAKKAIGIVGGLAVVATLAVVAVGKIGDLGFGFGSGGLGSRDGDGELAISSTTHTEESQEETQELNKRITIKVEEEKIYYDGKECKNTEELKNLICENTDDEVIYTYEHDYAIKSIDDEVKKLLSDLEESIGINIEY